jgi:hypothetical protein
MLNNLSAKVEKFDVNWFSSNKIRTNEAYSKIHSFFLARAEHPVKFSLLLFVIFNVLSFIIFKLDLNARGWNFFDTFVDQSDQVGYLGALWAVQASVVALLYPIVISYVTLLVGQQGKEKTILPIYLHDSCAVFSGVSSIVLIIQIGIHFLWMPHAEVNVVMSWVSLDTLWLIFNLCFTVYFLTKTVSYINPETRKKDLRRYLVNEIWPREAKLHLARNYFMDAENQNLLSDLLYQNHDFSSPKVITGVKGLNRGELALEIKTNTDITLVDVNFTFLNLGISSWLKRVNKQLRKTGNPKLTYQNCPSLSFPVVPFQSYKEKINVCFCYGDTKPNCYELLMFRFAFTYVKTKKVNAHVKVDNLLEDHYLKIMKSIRNEEFFDFNEAVDDLSDFFELILEASIFVENEESSNLALISDSSHWFQSRIFDVWTRQLLDVYELAAKQMVENSEYANKLLYVAYRLTSITQRVHISELVKHSLILNTLFLRRVGNCWSKLIQKHKIIDHGVCNPVQLGNPEFSIHNDFMVTYIGVWERTNENFKVAIKKDSTWVDCKELAGYFEPYMEQYVHAIYEKVFIGDKNSAEWLVDSLIKTNFTQYDNYDAFVYDNSIKNRFVNTRNFEARYVKYTGADSLNIALSNLWTDISCVLVYLLIQAGRDCECEKSLPRDLIGHMLDRKPIRKGGQVYNLYELVPSFEDVLIAILRQRYSKVGSYSKYLDGLVGNVMELFSDKVVSGRIYSGWGEHGVSSLMEEQLILLAVKVEDAWMPSQRLQDEMKEWSQERNEDFREFEDLVQNWIKLAGDSNFEVHLKAFACLRPIQRVKGNLQQLTISALQNLQNMLTGTFNQTILKAKIDDRKLQDISRKLSDSLFSNNNDGFSFRLFESIEKSENDLTEYSYKITGLSKGCYTKKELAPPIYNEVEFFENSLKEYIGVITLNRLIDTLIPTKVEASHQDAYWLEVKRFTQDAVSKKLTPILLVGSRVSPKCIFDWCHPYFGHDESRAPKDLIITEKNQDNDPRYVCHFNDIAVYTAHLPQATSILIVKESLKKFKVSENIDDSCIRVSCEEVEGHPDQINLVFNWAMDIEVSEFDVKAVQLNYLFD